MYTPHMQRSCQNPWCKQSFKITDSDLKFYDKISPVFGGKKYQVPAPTRCPECRQQRRLAWRNERKLYNSTCFSSGKQILSMYAQETKIRVLDQDEWWSDKWDALEYGRQFDSEHSLFEQFIGIKRLTPHSSLYTKNVENSYYTNYTLNLKNCYLILGGGNLEDCLYGKFITLGCNDVVDSYTMYNCEFCYEGVVSQHCYQCRYFTHCRNCSDCLMIEDCQSCKNCFLCFGLRDSEYCFLNQHVGKEEYERKIEELGALTVKKVELLRNRLDELKTKFPHRDSHIYASELCDGDMILNSNNCHCSFDIADCEDCKYIANAPNTLRSYDCNYGAPDGMRWSYELCSCCGTENAIGCFLCWHCNNILYSFECNGCRDCFACIGLKHKQYCILNKQYAKEEYESLVPKIIEHMQKTGEWGEFFPVELSPFAYNETVAQEYFPLSKEEVESRGWKWREEVDEVPQVEKIIPAERLPDSIDDIPDDVLNWAIKCEETGRPFRIVKQELAFYRKMKLPVPHLHPDERHKKRMALRNPRKLWKRECGKCGKEIQTTYAPERPEAVYCEECYLKEVY